jgi:hypothetical protein
VGGLQLPAELATLLNDVGYIWPNCDETGLIELGQKWITLGDSLRDLGQQARTAVGTAVSNNSGMAIDAFQAKWNSGKSAPTVLDQAAGGAPVVGAVLFVCAGVVLALKIVVIVQLTILLIDIITAIAEAPETFGGSLLQVPVVKKLCGMAINFAINEALSMVLG